LMSRDSRFVVPLGGKGIPVGGRWPVLFGLVGEPITAAVDSRPRFPDRRKGRGGNGDAGKATLRFSSQGLVPNPHSGGLRSRLGQSRGSRGKPTNPHGRSRSGRFQVSSRGSSASAKAKFVLASPSRGAEFPHGDGAGGGNEAGRDLRRQSRRASSGGQPQPPGILAPSKITPQTKSGQGPSQRKLDHMQGGLLKKGGRAPELFRQVAGSNKKIAKSMGPTKPLFGPKGPKDFDGKAGAFRELRFARRATRRMPAAAREGREKKSRGGRDCSCAGSRAAA